MTTVLDVVDLVSTPPIPSVPSEPTCRRPSSGHTIAAAPTGDRAQRVRDLLEYTASCADPGELRRCRQRVV
ncbi:MAG TPA: hypothetical protein VIC62_01895, partial [Nakamurella sp.]